MSQRETLLRYSSIIKKLRSGPANLKEIQLHLDNESDLQGYDLNTSARTFQRDLDDIRSLFQIDIRYDFSGKKYQIESAENEEYNERILDAFDTINALHLNEGMSKFLDFEKRRASGLEHFHGILHAIKNRFQLNFAYQSFWQNDAFIRKTNPYLLKEFKGRWYLIAKDLRDEKVKTYALDRFRNLDITKKRFTYPAGLDPREKFKNSFGIINSVEGSVPERIVLSFDAQQGKYVKTQPLHASQKTLIDDESEFRIEMKVYIAFDLVRELLSYGAALKVIEPKSLVNMIKEEHQAAFGRYL